MKKLLVLGAAFAAMTAAPAMASDSLAACQKFAADNGVDAEPCQCIADAVSSDPDLLAEQLALVTMEDYENSSAELHAAIDPCVEG